MDTSLALEVARRAVRAGAAAALPYWRADVRVETKPDRSPVTAADRASEAAILGVIRAAFPDHAVLAEESGRHDGRADARWVVDPLDGTRGFTRGGTHWGPLVALECAGEVVAGALALPALGETYWAARGHGAWMTVEDRAPVRLRVSSVARWDEAVVSLGELHKLLAPPHGTAVAALAAAAASARCYGDVASVAMLLTGRADAWIECGVQPWDLGPVPVLVEEAGGRFGDFTGRRTIESGHAIAANPALFPSLIAALKSQRAGGPDR